MAFKPLNLDAHTFRFDSASGCDLIDLYEKAADAEIRESDEQVKHKTFAPSSFRCKRLNWFRLRGVQPDKIDQTDLVLDFSAHIGESCHRLIQSRLSRALGNDWISVERHFSEFPPEFKYTLEANGFETFVEINDPPVRFACDGIIQLNGKRYLLEIKSSEYASFNDLLAPKPHHVTRVKCYATLMNISDVLMVYIDRQYGTLKCFEIHVSLSDMQQIRDDMKEVQEAVETNLAPEGLPVGDSWCRSNMCPYYKVCKEWGR